MEINIFVKDKEHFLEIVDYISKKLGYPGSHINTEYNFPWVWAYSELHTWSLTLSPDIRFFNKFTFRFDRRKRNMKKSWVSELILKYGHI